MIIKRKWFLRTWLGGTLAAMSLFSPFVSITAGAATPPKQLHDVTFSHDGKRLMFTLCGEKIPNGCAIHEYELTTGKLRYYTASENEVWGDARYSPQGDWIVFTITPVVNERRILEDTQLAIMRPDGKGLKRLTDSKGWKVAPSFSSSGKKIIYARAATMRKTGKTPAADFDIYSYDLSSGQEQRLTNFKFFQISRPFYFGDDERFIFSAEYPRQFPDLRENDRDAIKQRREQLQQEHKEDQIYFMKKGDINLKPWFRFNNYSNKPLVSTRSGKLFFHAQAYTADGKPDGVDYHEYHPDGKHRRITRVGDGTIWSADVSPDGKQLALIHSGNPGIQFGRPQVTRKLILLDPETGAARDIALPAKAIRIN